MASTNTPKARLAPAPEGGWLAWRGPQRTAAAALEALRQSLPSAPHAHWGSSPAEARARLRACPDS